MTKNDNVTIESLLKRVERLEKNGVPGLRDFLAVGALSMLSNDNTTLYRLGSERVAKDCYAIADSMIREREKYAS